MRIAEKDPINFLMERVQFDTNGGCWLWTGIVSNNYGRVRLDRNIGAHRFSYMTLKGAVPVGLHVLHKCDVPSCVNPDHLWLGTNHDNMMDKVRKGRAQRPNHVGSRHPGAKLSEKDIPAIRADTRTARLIAEQYGVTVHAIQNIRQGRNWSHV